MRKSFFAFCYACALLTLSSFTITLAEEYGKAGYYADSLHGRKTASGEKYDKTAYTAAHKSLPFGTKIRVTRLDTKQSVIVKVNDRGPFVEGYVVDVSRAAAEEIGLVKAGVARVKVEVVETADNTNAAAEKAPAPAQYNTAAKAVKSATPAKSTTSGSTTKLLIPKEGTTATRPATYSTADPKPASTAATQAGAATSTTDLYRVDLQKTEKFGFGVQVSTLYDADNILPIVTKLETQWPDKVLVSVQRDEANNQSTYRVIIGPYADRKAADTQRKLAEKRGYRKCFIIDLGGI